MANLPKTNVGMGIKANATKSAKLDESKLVEDIVKATIEKIKEANKSSYLFPTQGGIK